ncbi:conjugal transfer pilus assembly protein TraU [Burkholderia gladioli]|uniref:conjugal transfer pilus assembly protein TraU n=2 Tax=Burkholderia gladioli TaxID=28095 RepID=UPI00163F19F0|nr:conjugal transfer pilus assembly protein TraU [Burkholderia gladioli]
MSPVAMLRRRSLALAVLMGLVSFSAPADAGQCVGRFANPITDICWECAFPMAIGSVTFLSQGQDDTTNPGGFLCFCNGTFGVKFSFWEPIRRVDVTRSPYCFVSLGGISLNPGIRAPEGEVREQKDDTKQSFYQVHWYTDPVMYYTEILLDDPCMETGSFDVAYMTEVDPTWSDDDLTALLEPETYLFGSPIAQAACAGDCVLSSLGFGSNLLFWCAGCNGSIYPFNGHVQAHVSAIQASSLLVERMTAKLHREGLMWGTTGDDAMCGYYLQPVMDKTQYKYTMLYPVAQTDKINGQCCQPYGRSSALWGAGKMIPYTGEDFAYEIFRKRNCCMGANLGDLPQ